MKEYAQEPLGDRRVDVGSGLGGVRGHARDDGVAGRDKALGALDGGVGAEGEAGRDPIRTTVSIYTSKEYETTTRARTWRPRRRQPGR